MPKNTNRDEPGTSESIAQSLALNFTLVFLRVFQVSSASSSKDLHYFLPHSGQAWGYTLLTISLTSPTIEELPCGYIIYTLGDYNRL